MEPRLLAVLVVAAPGVPALVVGALRTLLLPLVVIPTVYVGLVAGWWGAGLGDGWEYGFAALCIISVVVVAAGLAVRHAIQR